ASAGSGWAMSLPSAGTTPNSFAQLADAPVTRMFASRRTTPAWIESRIALNSETLPDENMSVQLLRRAAAEFAQHLHELSHGLALHLLHDVRAVDFDGARAAAPFDLDHLRGLAVDHVVEQLCFAWRQRCEPLANLALLAERRTLVQVEIEGAGYVFAEQC